MPKKKSEDIILNELTLFDQEAIGDSATLIGVDEVGRGCLAGPVVAGAVRIEKDFLLNQDDLQSCLGIYDSKQVKADKRLEMFEKIKMLSEQGKVSYVTAEASVEEIEERNIVGATALAMDRCLRTMNVESLKSLAIIVDGRPMKKLDFPHAGVVKGDSLSLSIAMASIVAKVTRDQMMMDLDKEYPGYAFGRHKGYGTAIHVQAIKEYGVIEGLHRPRFLLKVLDQ